MNCGNDSGEDNENGAPLCSNAYFLGRELIRCALSKPLGKSHVAPGTDDLSLARIIFSSSCPVTFVADQLRFYNLEPLGRGGDSREETQRDPHALPLCLTGETVAVSKLNSIKQWSRINKWLAMKESQKGQRTCLKHEETYTDSIISEDLPQTKSLSE